KLRRFPRHKSFWQQIAEASRRGDSMSDQLSLSLLPTLDALRSALARSFVSLVADSLVSITTGTGELDGLRLGAPRRVGTGTPGLSGGGGSWMGGRGGMRAEWEGGRS
ncbi:hypothetical protein JCM8547_008337, partial [Rhodosporidiobolus lusitaniae]